MTNGELAFEEEHDFRPLAARMRAQSLDEYVVKHIYLPKVTPVASGRARTFALNDFVGPPGTGKTTLAELMATSADATVSRLSAITSGVKEIRQAIDEAKQRAQQQGRRTLLFADEVHRFNKSQQDAFLPLSKMAR